MRPTFAGVCPNCGHTADISLRPPLSKFQRKVLDFLIEYQGKHRIMPTQAEIAVHFKYRAISTVCEHLDNLQKKGWIMREHNHERSITIL